MNAVGGARRPPTVILEGSARLRWKRLGHASWRLERVWPSARERRWALREVLRRTEVVLVLDRERSQIDLLDEELSPNGQFERYVLERDRGITTLSVPAMDWLPQRLLGRTDEPVHSVFSQGEVVDGMLIGPRVGVFENIQLVQLQESRGNVLSARAYATLGDRYPGAIRGTEVRA